jgi:hypothetical protein
VTFEDLINIGVQRQNSGAFGEAESLYRQALALRPDSPEAWFDLGTVLDRVGKWDEAIAALRQAIRLQPDFPRAHWNLGAALLRQGDFQSGWLEYEWRWKVPELQINRIKCRQPQWHGEQLDGKKILLYAEQGFGDTIQFSQLIPEVVRRGGRLMLGCRRDLTALLGRLPGVELCLPQPGPVPGDFSVHCTLPSLPLALGTNLATIPARASYLSADPAKIAKWKDRLKNDGRRRIALVWAGRPTHADDMNRSIALTRLAPLATAPKVQWFSLQKGPSAARVLEFPAPIIDWTAELNDYDDTAALAANMDLIISVDTSVAHLAGALGKPTWVLIPFVPDWRWLLNRSDSPWYPMMRLFRQPNIGDWESVAAQVAGALKGL